jgi:hypothetical protein
MHFEISNTNSGIRFSFNYGDESNELAQVREANQLHPRRHYVYAHLDSSGKMFYIGKGCGDRAWSMDRHDLWFRYVQKHLGGKYDVQILQDDLEDEDADQIEAAWISKCGDTLVNWINMGRKTDFEALSHRNKLSDANRLLIQKGRIAETQSLEEAAAIFIQAIDSISGYAFIKYEQGFIGELLDDENAEVGFSGEIAALDRLTLCLIKLGRIEEAASRTRSYFQTYRRDQYRVAAKRIIKRVEKATARPSK